MSGEVPRGRLLAISGDDGAAPDTLRPGPLSGVRLVVSGVPVGDLAPGTRLRIGADATVELDGSSVDTGGVLEAGSAGRIAARVVDGGIVAPGDPVTVEAVVLPLADVLDLHPFRPEDVEAVVVAYLAEARASRLPEVRIVHGRGRGVQRALVQRLLARAPGVDGFADAPPERGGWGATIVRLRSAGDPGTG